MISVYKSKKKLPLLSAGEVRELELQHARKTTSETYVLMQQAGRALWQCYQEKFSQYKNILVLVGPGNNGGDGYEFACHVLNDVSKKKNSVIKVRVRFVADNNDTENWIKNCRSDASLALEKLLAIYDDLQPFNRDDLNQSDVVIDGILGTGIKPPAREIFSTTIKAVNQSQLPVLSIDTPSGLDTDRGIEIGEAINARVTLTFIALKKGLVTGAGKSHCGELYLHTLGVDKPQLALSESRYLTPLSSLSFMQKITQRNSNTHKGDFGRTLIIGGNCGMGGAAILAAEASCRVGSGSVVLVTHPQNVSSTLARRPEVMVHGFSDDEIEQPAQIEKLISFLKGSSSVVIGPGLGQDSWAKILLETTLEWCKQQHKNLVLDADGLRLAKKLAMDIQHCIITPHPGEAAFLLSEPTDKITTAEIQQDRYYFAEKLQDTVAQGVILKGAGSILVTTEKNEINSETHQQINVCPYGNAGMASAGMGDVLAGTIGGLMAQGLTPSNAALSGMLIHSLAADRAAKGDEVGLLASDLFSELKFLVNHGTDFSEMTEEKKNCQ